MQLAKTQDLLYQLLSDPNSFDRQIEPCVCYQPVGIEIADVFGQHQPEPEVRCKAIDVPDIQYARCENVRQPPQAARCYLNNSGVIVTFRPSLKHPN